jgi:hypothetical protein
VVGRPCVSTTSKQHNSLCLQLATSTRPLIPDIEILREPEKKEKAIQGTNTKETNIPHLV